VYYIANTVCAGACWPHAPLRSEVNWNCHAKTANMTQKQPYSGPGAPVWRDCHAIMPMPRLSHADYQDCLWRYWQSDVGRMMTPDCALPRVPMPTMTHASWRAPGDWIGAAKSAKLAKWPCADRDTRIKTDQHVPCGCARAVLLVAVGLSRGAISGCCRPSPSARRCRPGAGGGWGTRAGARVTVTGTTRKQFFIFYKIATQFIATLPAHPASSIMVS